jgi:carbon dioxide concentrating mechanism protein CcmL
MGTCQPWGAARQVLGSEQRPVDAAVVAIIDTVNVDNRSSTAKKTKTAS